MPNFDVLAVGQVERGMTSGTSETKRQTVTRHDVLSAALKLVGPHRSVSTLTLREVAREAGIAPNSFYRHFRDTDELAVAMIDQAGESLRRIIREARLRAGTQGSITRSSVEAFMEQLNQGEALPLLLREGVVGSTAFKQALDAQLHFFEDELLEDLQRISAATGTKAYELRLLSRAITRLVFAMGAHAMNQDEEGRARTIEETIIMVKMLLAGAQALAR